MVTYRPIVLAKRGELTALGALPARAWASMTPVLRVPPREWDFDKSTFKKSLEDHVAGLPKRLAAATKGRRSYIDVNMLDILSPVFRGVHVLTWLVDQAANEGLELIPFVQSGSDPSTLRAAADINARHRSGVALRLPAKDWMSITPGTLPALLSGLGLKPGEVDVFVDVTRDFNLVLQPAVLTELSAQDAVYTFRSRSVGGAAFPDTAGLRKGLSEFSRDDWRLFVATYRARLKAGDVVPDFFDNVVQNPEVEVGAVNPRFLMISALFRYTTDEEWLIAKGDLFKGPAGKSLGSASMLTPLTLLRAHPKFAMPIRTATDDWINAVVAGTQNPGNPETWRRWATERHLTVAAHQLASPI